MQPLKKPEPHNIRLETPDYIVRTMAAGDDVEGWRDWLMDPETARNLNMRPLRLGEGETHAYIASFNGTTSHLLGIFAKITGRLVGIRAVYVDPNRKEFLVNVLIGGAGARNKGARTQSRTAVYRYFFEDLDLHTARATVLAVNEHVLAGMEKRGWVHEHTDYKPNVNGDGLLELRHFRLSRDRWRELASQAK